MVKQGNELKVIDSVNWYHGEVEPTTVAEVIRRIRPSDSHLWHLERAKGGRPTVSKEHKTYPEAIVCAVLKDKQRLSYKQIAEQFG